MRGDYICLELRESRARDVGYTMEKCERLSVSCEARVFNGMVVPSLSPIFQRREKTCLRNSKKNQIAPRRRLLCATL